MNDLKVNPSYPKEHSTMQEQGDGEGGIVEGADSIQDQIIIAPEIMSRILEQLDLQTLKRVRLVCKSWLREAGTHMKKKGSVHFSSRMIQEFLDTLQTGRPELPQPFRSITFGSYETEDSELLVSQLASLCPPLVITGFWAERIPLDLTVALIIESSPTLEYLYLMASTLGQGCRSLTRDENVLLRLRVLHVDLSQQHYSPSSSEDFPSVVAWIVQCSPNLETYRCWGDGGQSVEALLKVGLGNVKTLDLLCRGSLADHVLSILSVPFSRLENLRMSLDLQVQGDLFMTQHELVRLHVVTVAKCTDTLRILDLSVVENPDLLTDFPVCPHLRELSLRSFPKSVWDLLPLCFPALEVLNVNRISLDVDGDSWTDLAPFLGLRTLRVCRIAFGSEDDDDNWRDESSGGDGERIGNEDWIAKVVKFFDKFPALDCFRADSSFVLKCCSLEAGGDSRFSSFMEGVKHLELTGTYNDLWTVSDLAPLAVLKGIESIAITSFLSGYVLSLPYKDMPSLKVIQFHWVWNQRFNCPMDQLLEMARGVEKVVVNGGCPDRGSPEYLDFP